MPIRYDEVEKFPFQLFKGGPAILRENHIKIPQIFQGSAKK